MVRANAPLGKEVGVAALNATSAPTRIALRYFNSSPEVIRLAVLMYVKYPLSLRNVEDLLHERRIDISHETVRYWGEPVRSTVRRRHRPTAGKLHAPLSPMAVALRRCT